MSEQTMIIDSVSRNIRRMSDLIAPGNKNNWTPDQESQLRKETEELRVLHEKLRGEYNDPTDKEVFVVLQTGAWAGEDCTEIILVTEDEQKAVDNVKARCAEYNTEVEDDHNVEDFNSRGGNLSIHTEKVTS